MRDNKRYIILTFIITIIIGLFVLNHSLQAQNNIQLPTLKASRGEIINVPIIGTINKTGFSNIKLILSYDYFMLNILDTVITKSNYGIKSANPPIYSNSDGIYTIEISSSDVQEINNDTLCQLRVEILAGNKNSAQISPDTLYLNNAIDTATFSFGIINLTDPPIIKSYPEGFGVNYPNPISEIEYNKSRFPFNIEKSTTVEFKIFDLSGSKALSKDDYKDAITIYYLQDDGLLLEKKVTDNLSPGVYYLDIIFNEKYFSSGVYTIIMKTKNDVYHRNFMIVR
jgi:hypothetical protein